MARGSGGSCNSALDPQCMRPSVESFWPGESLLHLGETVAVRPHGLRGGGPTREEIEEQIKAERAAAAEEEKRLKEIQDRKKREREDAKLKSIVPRGEEEDRALALRRKRQRLLPEGELTLQKISDYANAVYEEGEVDEAIGAYNRLLSIDPTDAPALFHLASIYQDDRDNVEMAENYLEMAVESDPTHVPVLLRLAWVHSIRRMEKNVYGTFDQSLCDKRDSDAEDCYRKALNVDPNNPEVLMGLGSFMCHVRGDDAAAQEYLSRAVQANPLNVEAMSCYAHFLEEAKQDLQGAQMLFTRAVALDPEHGTCLANRARFLHKSKKDLGAAEKAYRYILDREPANAEACSLLAELLLDQGREEEALELYDRAEEEAPEDADILHDQAAYLYLIKNDTKEAMGLLHRAVLAQPNHSRALSSLGGLVEAQGDWIRAEALYGRAITIDPSSSVAAFSLANILEKRRDKIDMADSYLQRAVDGVPQVAEYQFAYGAFLEKRRRDLVAAEVMYQRTLMLDPQHTGALCNLGNIFLLRRNDTFAAEQLYASALRVAPDDVGLMGNTAEALHQRAMQQHANVSRDTYEFVKAQSQATYQAAEELFEKVLAIAPDNVQALTNYGFLLAQLRHDDANAERMFATALKIAPDNVATMSNHALLVCSDGSLRRAEEILLRALAIDPAHVPCEKNLRFVRRLLDKQRIHLLSQRQRLQYPTAQYSRPGAPAGYNAAAAGIMAQQSHGQPAPQTYQGFSRAGGGTGAAATQSGVEANAAVDGEDGEAVPLEPGGALAGSSWSLAGGQVGGGESVKTATQVQRETGRNWNVRQEFEKAQRQAQRELKEKQAAAVKDQGREPPQAIEDGKL